MSDCTECADGYNKKKTSIGSTKCNDECPTSTNCGDDILFTDCIFLSGSNLSCIGSNNGDTLTSVLSKINNKYGVRVTSNDACCGFLFDKIVSDTLTKSVVVESGCQKLKLEVNADGGACEELEWVDLELESPFVSGSNIEYDGGEIGIVFDFGESQEVQYASDPCNGKVYMRGIFEVPSGVTLDYPFTLVATLPGGFRPQKTRMLPIGLFATGDNDLWVTMVIMPNGEIYISSTGAATVIPSWISFDGFSFET